MMRTLCRFCLCLTMMMTAVDWQARSQEPASAARIVGIINEDQLVTLRGNLPPAVMAESDRGRVSPDMPMSDLVLVLKRSPEQQAAFDSLVESQHDINSSNYHHWLEPGEVGEKFGPSLVDIQTISSWLTKHGLRVEGYAKDRMTIRFSGRAAQVEQAFHAELHNIVVRGETYFANVADPQIPLAIEPVVAGPKALHNFVPRPLHKVGGSAVFNPDTGKWERIGRTSPFALLDESKRAPRPQLGINLGAGTSASVVEDVTPYDFATIYNILPLWNDSIDGSGQTIAIAGRSNVRPTDVASFRSNFGLPPGAFNVILNGQDPGYCTGSSGFCTLGEQVENALDVEWAGAVAKGATVDLIVTQQTATNDAVFESASYVVTNKIASILSASYGLCELGLGTLGNASYNNLWQTAAAEGIAVFIPSGDSGSPACDQGLDTTKPYSARLGLSVNGLASSPFNTAVGGTDFTWCNPTASTQCVSGSPYWRPSNAASTGANALGYVPETPWNDTCTSPTGTAYIKTVASVTGLGVVSTAESACNFIKNNYGVIFSRYGIDLSFLVDVSGTGGGASSCISSDGSTVATCSGSHAKPAWQTGLAGILNDGKRDLPDVSFFAGSGLWNSAYLICISDAGPCLTTTSPSSRPIGQEVGGTSVAAPAMAGVMALINQKAGSVQGNPNVGLYQLAARQSYSNCASETASTSNGCYFNDVDKGTNAMACTAGSVDCVTSIQSNTVGVLTGHNATAGYDMATGLGTLNVANVVKAWSATTGSAIATVTVSPSATSIQTNQSLNVSIKVQGASATPTGSVTLSAGTYVSSAQTLSSGTASFTIPANTFMIGTHELSARYSGDSIYAPGSGTGTIAVLEASKLTPNVSVAPASRSIAKDQSLAVAVTVTGSAAMPAGNVALTAGQYASTAALTGGAANFVIPANALSVGDVVITASYGGDSTYASSTANTTVTVSKLTPTITVFPDSSSIDSAQSLNVTVTVSGSSETPTGTVSISGGGFSSSAEVLSAGKFAFRIPERTLAVGSSVLTAQYSGDSAYLSGTGSTTITVTSAASGTYALEASAPGAITAGSSAGSMITVASTDGYSGTVTLSCALTAYPPGAQYLPVCSPVPGGTTILLSSSVKRATGNVSVTTTGPSTALAVQHSAGAMAVFALVILWVVPIRSRRWPIIQRLLILLALLESVTACGGGGGRPSDGGSLRTTAGTYAFTVQGTGNPAINPAPAATFSVTVN